MRTPLALETRQAQLLEEEPVHDHFVLSATAVRSRKQNHVTDFSLGIKKRDEDLVILLSPSFPSLHLFFFLIFWSLSY